MVLAPPAASFSLCIAAATVCACSGESVSTTVGVWYDCSTASTCLSQKPAPLCWPERLPSLRKSYWMGSCASRKAA